MKDFLTPGAVTNDEQPPRADNNSSRISIGQIKSTLLQERSVNVPEAVVDLEESNFFAPSMELIKRARSVDHAKNRRQDYNHSC